MTSIARSSAIFATKSFGFSDDSALGQTAGVQGKQAHAASPHLSFTTNQHAGRCSRCRTPAGHQPFHATHRRSARTQGSDHPRAEPPPPNRPQLRTQRPSAKDVWPAPNVYRPDPLHLVDDVHDLVGVLRTCQGHVLRGGPEEPIAGNGTQIRGSRIGFQRGDGDVLRTLD